ncbi:MAG: ECF-type sigma factor [Phycisphaerales bacterium]
MPSQDLNPAPISLKAWFDAAYPDLRAIAQACFSHESRDKSHTLTPTSLVHEAFVKLQRAEDRGTLQQLRRAQFFPAAARAMREVLVDHARKRISRLSAEAHGSQARVALSGAEEGTRLIDFGPSRAEEILDLDAAITGLERFDPEAARLVTLRFFAGLTVPVAAEVMGIGESAAEGMWRASRAWLARKLIR